MAILLMNLWFATCSLVSDSCSKRRCFGADFFLDQMTILLPSCVRIQERIVCNDYTNLCIVKWEVDVAGLVPLLRGPSGAAFGFP